MAPKTPKKNRLRKSRRRRTAISRQSTPSQPPLRSSSLYYAAYGPIILACRALLGVLTRRVVVTGKNRIPLRGPVIFAPNHISDIDPPVVGISIHRPLWYLAKRELFSIPAIGPFMRFAQSIPVDRGQPDRAALRYVDQLLKTRQAVVIFPEGQLSEDGELQPLLPGVALLALRANVPIIPVGIHNTNAILPYKAVMPRPTLKTVRVHIGEPISMDEFADLPARKQRELVMEKLESGLRGAISYARRTA